MKECGLVKESEDYWNYFNSIAQNGYFFNSSQLLHAQCGKKKKLDSYDLFYFTFARYRFRPVRGIFKPYDCIKKMLSFEIASDKVDHCETFF